MIWSRVANVTQTGARLLLGASFPAHPGIGCRLFVRHPVGTDARLAALLRLLVSRFGIRTAEGYRLPFSLGHTRMAELICATRSTVTRQLMLLSQAGQVRQEDTAGGLLLMPSFVQQGPELRTR
jgi:CRP-like cAMP-binding protein